MSWSRKEIITLRNRAASRAQQCAPIVQEAEELVSLIKVLDSALTGGATPQSTALRELAPVTGDEQPEPDSPKRPSKSQCADAVEKFLHDIAGEEVGIGDIASMLKMNYKTTKWALGRLTAEGKIQRPRHGRYCYRQSLAA